MYKIIKIKLRIIGMELYEFPFCIEIISIYPQAPVAQKVADEVVFRRFQGEGVEFFLNRTSLTPIRFSMRIFWKIPIEALPDFIFQCFLYQDHVLCQTVF